MTTHDVVDTTRPLGNVGAGLASLISNLGLAAPDQRDTAIGVAEEALCRKGLSAEVVSMRYGVLTLASDPRSARLIDFDRDVLLAAIERRCPGAVTEIRVTSRAPGRPNGRQR